MHTGVLDHMRDILAEADDSLTASEVINRLRARGVEFAISGVSGMLSTCTKRGELIANDLNGQRCYTLNPEPPGTTDTTDPGGDAPIRIRKNQAVVNKADLVRVVRLALRVPGAIADADRAAMNALSEVMYP